MNKIKFWQLQKEADLTNKECAEYLETNIRTVGRWRIDKPSAPKAVILALEAYITKQRVNDESKKDS